MHSIHVICLFKTQVNIVTTRSNINSSHTKFSKGVHNSNYYAKFQNNFYNNQQFQNTHNRFRPQNKNNNNRKQPMVTIHVSIRNTCKITWIMYHIRFIFNKWMHVDDSKMWSRIDKAFVTKKPHPKHWYLPLQWCAQYRIWPSMLLRNHCKNPTIQFW